jgi:hypothetical protein
MSATTAAAAAAARAAARAARTAPVTAYAHDRDEADTCEAGTPGCSVSHTRSTGDVSCECW